ncbi:MAG: hypothetical protein EYC70_01425 [Planctomycetota bacterium]|nr:MAG: hypothetical protein EYC70_01425 [Planctomycetota bacterium]
MSYVRRLTHLRTLFAAAWLGLLLPAPAEVAIHAPHDNAYAVAVGFLPDGREEVVVITDDKTVLSSRDGMLSFGLLAGDGLDTERPTSVTYNPSLTWSNGLGSGIFFIGTERGIWMYEPSENAGTGPLQRFSYGIPNGADQRNVISIASADGEGPGQQPTFVMTMDGRVYRLAADGSGWRLVLETGVRVQQGGLVLAPGFRYRASGKAATVFASVNNTLYRSETGGGLGSWEAVETFGGWLVTALALDSDYGRSSAAQVYVGLGRPASTPPGDKGEIHVSSNDGNSFTRRLALDSSVTSIAAAPDGPTRGATVYAVGREYPGANGYSYIGVLMSRDRGASWSDEGNEQSFVMEHEPGHASGYNRLRYVSQLVVMPRYGRTGRVLYARNEGLFVSEDEGHLWWEVALRGTREARNVVASVDAHGHLHVFAASYGQGLQNQNVDTGVEHVAPAGMGQVHTLPIAVSPDFAADGAVYTGATNGLGAWFDPVVDPPNNVFQTTGARSLPLIHEDTGDRLLRYIRSMALSPNFSAAPGSPDQVLYFGAWEGEVYVSENAGLTCREANRVAGGGTLPYASDLAIAPTFNPSLPHADVYLSAQDGKIYRMTNGRWFLIADLDVPCSGIEVDPMYHPLSNRRLWAATDSGAGVKEILDYTSAAVSSVGSGLPDARITSLAVGLVNEERWLYASTWADGVYRLRLAGEQLWKKLTTSGYPRAFAKGITLSPDWPEDTRVFVATGDGVFVLDERSPQPSWNPVFDSQIMDNREASVLQFSPAHARVPDPTLPWKWQVDGAGTVRGGAFGEDVSVARQDGDFLQFRGIGKGLGFHTYSGAGMGTVVISARSLADGTPLGAVTVDLSQRPADRHVVQLDFGLVHPVPFEARVNVVLDAGEEVVYDVLEFQR